MDRDLFRDFLLAYPFQPATALWRAVEIGAMLAHPLPEGLGLDLGCGDGKLTRILLDRLGPRTLVGVDLDREETEQAAALRFYERVHTTPADRIPEADADFDFVISNSVLEHIPELGSVLAEVSRLLKPGGRFVFTVPSGGFHRCLRGPLMPWVSRERYLDEIDRRLAHVRYPLAEDWRELLSAKGLELDRVACYLSRAEVRRWETISRMTAGLLFTLFGKKHHPIEIQRKLGMRSLQSRAALPRPVAAALAAILGLGLGRSSARGPGELENGCLLLAGRKV